MVYKIPNTAHLAQSSNTALQSLLGGADRFVVVDTETTGVYSRDRVLEIALITMSPDGHIMDVWDTLIQPERAVTATHIHGITAKMVSGAPTFDEVAGDVALRLEGAAVIAHNFPFDYRMLNSEFSRIGVTLENSTGIDTLSATRLKLSEACAVHGLPIAEQHQARNDALATAQLALKVAKACEIGSPTKAPRGLQRTGRVLRRKDTISGVLPDSSTIAAIAARLKYDLLEPAILVYLDVLERAFEDLCLDNNERSELEFIARSVGLNKYQINQAHQRYINQLIDDALADHVLTDEEQDQILRVSAALDIDIPRIEMRIRPFQKRSDSVCIKPGMNVVFTGDHPTFTRTELEEHAELKGLIVQKTVTRQTDLVSAAELESNSGTMQKARRYNLPIVTIEYLLNFDTANSVLLDDNNDTTDEQYPPNSEVIKAERGDSLLRMRHLAELIGRWDSEYYRDAAPSVSDSDYDTHKCELLDLERRYPDMADPNSPTQRVGEYYDN